MKVIQREKTVNGDNQKTKQNVKNHTEPLKISVYETMSCFLYLETMLEPL